jgi:hypothetical protein
MRDAFGGAFMIKLFLVFIIVYVGFIAVALNYAKAFKVKNKVVEYLETNEIQSIKTMTAVDFTEMEEYFEKDILGKMNYRVNKSCPKEYEYCQNGILIVKVHPTESQTNKLGDYYKVSTYFGWSIPFINAILAINGSDRNAPTVTGIWTISGETRPIVNE